LTREFCSRIGISRSLVTATWRSTMTTNIIHADLEVPIEEFEFAGRLYGGVLVVEYTRDRDYSVEWEPELLRLVDVSDGEADWEDDDVRSTVAFDSELGRALLADHAEYVADTCRDDCRWL